MLFSNFPLLRNRSNSHFNFVSSPPKKINENYFQTTFQQSNKLATISQYIKFSNFALPSFPPNFRQSLTELNRQISPQSFQTINQLFSSSLSFSFSASSVKNSRIRKKIPETFRNKSSRGMSE